MAEPNSTAERILDASRRLFNERGYAATTVADIAAAVGIAPGNVTYHFPTKHSMVEAIRDEASERMQKRRRREPTGDLVVDYVARLVTVYETAAAYRFLLRDRATLDDAEVGAPPPVDVMADFHDLRATLDGLEAAGLFRSDLDTDLDLLTRTLWIFGRHWPDHLREMEQRTELTSADQRRGMDHHLAILRPHLTAKARRQFQQALEHQAPA